MICKTYENRIHHLTVTVDNNNNMSVTRYNYIYNRHGRYGSIYEAVTSAKPTSMTCTSTALETREI
jgi:hypothetical protein